MENAVVGKYAYLYFLLFFFSVMFSLSLDYYFAAHIWSCTLTVLNLRGKLRLNEKFLKNIQICGPIQDHLIKLGRNEPRY